MRINKLGFLSFLAVLGFFGYPGFFAFIYYIRYFFVRPDEMFQYNVRGAASIGFFSGIASTGFAILLHFFLPDIISAKMVLASSYVVSVFVFTVVLVIFELKELRGC